MEHYPPERFLVFQSEKFYENPGAFARSVGGFLGLPRIGYHGRDGSPRKNEGSYESMDEEVRRDLVEYFEPHNRELYALLGTDFGWS